MHIGFEYILRLARECHEWCADMDDEARWRLVDCQQLVVGHRRGDGYGEWQLYQRVPDCQYDDWRECILWHRGARQLDSLQYEYRGKRDRPKWRRRYLPRCGHQRLQDHE